MKNILGEVVSAAGLKQLRAAETEKYPHVTFFFNGGLETPFEGEERYLAISPKEVATYDQKPQMSAPDLAFELVRRMGNYDLVIINFANPDMVGHTGIVEAGVHAVETIDLAYAWWWKRFSPWGANSSSRPTMVTASRCVMPTAHPTRLTPRTLCTASTWPRTPQSTRCALAGSRTSPPPCCTCWESHSRLK